MAGATVLQAVKARLLVTTAVNTIIGTQAALGQAPETWAPPFVVVEHGGTVPNYRTGGAMAKHTRLWFACYAQEADRADTLANAVMGAFDPSTANPGIVDDLGITNESTTRIAQVPPGYQLLPEPVRLPNGTVAFVGRVPYEIMTARAW